MGLKELEARINKEYGANVMSTASENKLLKMGRFSSGSLMLDIDLGGGWPELRTIELFGPESVGKSFLLYHAVAQVTNRTKNNKAVIIDEEGSWDNAWALAIGANLDNVKVVRSQYAEQALDILEMTVESGEAALVGLDSIAALIPKVEKEESHEDWKMALTARLMNKACRKMYSALKMCEQNGGNTAVFFINQIRIKLGVSYGNPETTTGGNAMKFAASVRLDVRKDGDDEKDDGEHVIGVNSKYTTVKNKTAPPRRKGAFRYYVAKANGYGAGQIDNGLALFQVGLETGGIIQSGAWYTGSWLGKNKYQGEDKCSQYITSLTTERKNALIELIEESVGYPVCYRFGGAGGLGKMGSPKVKTARR